MECQNPRSLPISEGIETTSTVPMLLVWGHIRGACPSARVLRHARLFKLIFHLLIRGACPSARVLRLDSEDGLLQIVFNPRSLPISEGIETVSDLLRKRRE